MFPKTGHMECVVLMSKNINFQCFNKDVRRELMNLRKVSIDDFELLIRLRIDYLIEDRGSISQDEKQKIELQLRDYFPKHISDGTFIGVVAEEDNKVISVAFLSISEKPANPAFITGKTGTLLNVHTYSQYRRKGIATKVIMRIIEEARSCGVSYIDLSATSDGKPLYKKLGFNESKYTAMGIKLI